MAITGELLQNFRYLALFKLGISRRCIFLSYIFLHTFINLAKYILLNTLLYIQCKYSFIPRFISSFMSCFIYCFTSQFSISCCIAFTYYVPHLVLYRILYVAMLIFLGCGIQWGVYLRGLSSGLAKESGNLETGDYVNTVRSIHVQFKL